MNGPLPPVRDGRLVTWDHGPTYEMVFLHYHAASPSPVEDGEYWWTPTSSETLPKDQLDRVFTDCGPLKNWRSCDHTGRRLTKIERLLVGVDVLAAAEIDWRPDSTIPEDFYAM